MADRCPSCGSDVTIGTEGMKGYAWCHKCGVIPWHDQKTEQGAIKADTLLAVFCNGRVDRVFTDPLRGIYWEGFERLAAYAQQRVAELEAERDHFSKQNLEWANSCERWKRLADEFTKQNLELERENERLTDSAHWLSLEKQAIEIELEEWKDSVSKARNALRHPDGTEKTK